VPKQKTKKRTRATRATRATSDALVIMARLTGSSPTTADLIEQERSNLDIARTIYELRTGAKLSQAELAKRVGTTQAVISRIEDADYAWHYLTVLRRIASALDRRVEIRFVSTLPPACELQPVRRR
jgi:DNA-binding XRE family transcriptional regulator